MGAMHQLCVAAAEAGVRCDVARRHRRATACFRARGALATLRALAQRRAASRLSLRAMLRQHERRGFNLWQLLCFSTTTNLARTRAAVAARASRGAYRALRTWCAACAARLRARYLAIRVVRGGARRALRHWRAVVLVMRRVRSGTARHPTPAPTPTPNAVVRHDRYDLGAEIMRPALIAIASHRARLLGGALRQWCAARRRMQRRQRGLQLLQRAVLVLRHHGMARAMHTWAAVRDFQARQLHLTPTLIPSLTRTRTRTRRCSCCRPSGSSTRAPCAQCAAGVIRRGSCSSNPNPNPNPQPYPYPSPLPSPSPSPSP